MSRHHFTPRLLTRVLLVLAALCGLSVLPAQAQVSVLTQHNDNLRTGANLGETVLTTANVNTSTFGKLFSLPVDGFTYAQPLYVPRVVIPGTGTLNVVYVATAHDSVYAFDADKGTLLWKTSLGVPVPSSVINTPNIQVEVGIISTPVIDPATQTLYVVAKTFENSKQIFRLHALDLTTGAEKLNGPTVITASVAGTGEANDGTGHVPFVAEKENQRASLTLAGGSVYIAFASHEDYNPYHGWVLAYSAVDLTQKAAFNVTPNGGEGGIWMSGQGLVADAASNVYAITGNSSIGSDTSAADYGESFLKLTLSGNALTVADYFKPYNFHDLNINDTDLGSGGPVGIPGTTEIIGAGKQGLLYVLNTNAMGGLNPTTDAVMQKFSLGSGLWGALVFWNSATAPALYVWGVGDRLKTFPFHTATGLFDTTPSSTGTFSVVGGGDPCGALTVSSNASAAGTGIVWACVPLADPDHDTVQGTLYAFDAANVRTVLWSSRQNVARDDFGNFAKFLPPTVANGKVYVGTNSGQVCVYGLLAQPSPPPAPASLFAAAGNGQISLSWTASAGAATYSILRSSASGAEALPALATGVTTTSYTDTGLTNGTTYYYQVVAVNTIGSSAGSNEAFATPTAATGSILSLNFVGNGASAPLGAGETAGVVPAANWNNGTGAAGTLALLTDNLGVVSGAAATWACDAPWTLPITENAGNARMMKGYLDTPTGTDTVTVKVSSLPTRFSASGYDVYVYTDGDNSGARTGSYTIGATTLTATDPAGVNFSGTFTQATNSVGNYLKFPNVGGTGFTLTATPGAATDGTLRAPVNAVQIVAHPAVSLPLVTVKSVASKLPYTVATARVGTLQYSDRTYTITGLSPTLTEAALVQTANSDKYAVAPAFLTLTLSAPATVYVCYDGRGKRLPKWLNDGRWKLSTETFATTDATFSPAKVYSKSFPAGDLILGGNFQAPATGAGSNYSVVVKAN